MIRTIYYSPDGEIEVNPAPEVWKQVFDGAQGFLWFDIVEEEKLSAQKLFGEIFGFHELVIEDAIEETHVPKVNPWEGYLYMVMHAIDSEAMQRSAVISSEVDIFLSERYLVTYQSSAIPMLDTLWHELKRERSVCGRGPGYLLYLLAKEMVDEYLLAVEGIRQGIDALEYEVYNEPKQVILERLFDGRRTLLAMRRIFGPQREVFDKLGRGDFYYIRDAERVYFRDIFDHMVRLEDMIDSQRDLLAGILAMYQAVVGSRMNEAVKTLTDFSVMFLPVIYLAGFFGMRFFPGDISEAAFFVVLVLLVGLPLGLFFWLRKRLKL